MQTRGTLLALAVLAASCASEPKPAPVEEAAPPAAPTAAAAEIPAEVPKAKDPAELPRVVYYVISEA